MPKVRVIQGCNAWRLLRTDADGAPRDRIPQTAAAVIRYWLTGAHEASPEVIPTGSREWRFGPVRPLQVASVSHQAQRLPDGEMLADRHMLSDTVPTVRGKRPWYVLVYFWWRKPDIQVTYPSMRTGWLGPRQQLDAADWVLDRAVAVRTHMHDPGDQSWGAAQGRSAARAARGATEDLTKTVLPAMGSGLIILAILYGLSKR